MQAFRARGTSCFAGLATVFSICEIFNLFRTTTAASNTQPVPPPATTGIPGTTQRDVTPSAPPEAAGVASAGEHTGTIGSILPGLPNQRE